MAISFSRPDPSSPSAVATAAFTTSRKGYEQAEVREFLRMVAAELARLQEREKFLERELRTADTDLGDMVGRSPAWRERDNLLRSVPGVGDGAALPSVAHVDLALGT
jgi:DivIVA domain-containing protein